MARSSPIQDFHSPVRETADRLSRSMGQLFDPLVAPEPQEDRDPLQDLV